MIGALWLACTTPTPPAQPPPPQPSTAAPAPSPEPRPAPAATVPPDPLAGLTDAEICSSDALLMLKYPFDALQNGTCATVCCAADAEHWCCQLDWPFSDVPSCEAYATLRNGIFAAYGYPFSDAKWRALFEAEPTYTRREDFDPSWLTAVATTNVATLKAKETGKVACLD